MSTSSSSSLTTSCDTTFISSDSSTLSYDGPSNLENSHNDTSLSFSQIFTARRKARACSVPHILPSVNNFETSPISLHLTDDPPKILENSSKNSMSSSFRDIRRFDGSTLSNSFLRTNKTTLGGKQKFRSSSYSLTQALEDPIPDDVGPCFPSRSSSIKKLFQAPSPRINQLKQEEGMERETTHERSTHINLLLSNTWEDLALDGFDKEKNCSTKNSKDSPMSDHAIDQVDQNGNHGYHTDFSAFKDDNTMNAKSLLSPNSNNTKSNNPYLPFRAISSPTGKCYASKRSLSPVIKLKPSSICIKRKYDSDNDSCTSSPPIKKHHSYSLTTEQCNPNLTSIFNSNPCSNPYDNRSLPPSPVRLFDFAHGTSRSSSPCYSEESNRAYEFKLNELDCIASTGSNNGNGVAKCCPNPGLPPTCPFPLQKQSYFNKGYNVPLRLGFSLNNIDCQDNKSFNHYSHSLRAKSLISPLSFRCFPSRDMMGSPLPSLWSPTLTRTTVAPASTNDNYDDCSTADEAVLSNLYYGTPDSTEGPFETNHHYTCVSPIATSTALAYIGGLSPASSSSYPQSLYSSSSKDIFCHVTPSTSHNSALTRFVPINSSARSDDSPRPDRQFTPQHVGSPADSALDVGCIEATVYSNTIEPFPKNYSDQMDIDGREVTISRPPLPTTVGTPERLPIISVPLTSQ